MEQPLVEQLSPRKSPMPAHNYCGLTHLGGEQLHRWRLPAVFLSWEYLRYPYSYSCVSVSFFFFFNFYWFFSLLLKLTPLSAFSPRQFFVLHFPFSIPPVSFFLRDFFFRVSVPVPSSHSFRKVCVNKISVRFSKLPWWHVLHSPLPSLSFTAC